MGKLYVVGTPIGNLNDWSPRAEKTLREVDFIAAEDTRVTLKLLNKFDIHTPLLSYHDHNRAGRGPEILARLQQGESCALVTDAGMPAISDPGEDLVRLCRENGVEVESVPGPVAFATALAVSGMPAGRFTFEGFLSVNKQSRNKHLQSLQNETRTMLFYEAPHKLAATLRDLYAALGDRDVALCRELTKLHEQVIRTTLSQAATLYETQKPLGEFVLIVAGKPEQAQQHFTLSEAVELVLQLVQGGMALSAAAKEVSAQTGFQKGTLYKQAARRRSEN